MWLGPNSIILVAGGETADPLACLPWKVRQGPDATVSFSYRPGVMLLEIPGACCRLFLKENTAQIYYARKRKMFINNYIE
jgi:hypothetical protein